MSRKNQERRNEIQKILIRQENVKVEELSEALHVTPETIRTDLNYLEQKGFLFRKHGGAALRTGALSGRDAVLSNSRRKPFLWRDPPQNQSGF